MKKNILTLCIQIGEPINMINESDVRRLVKKKKLNKM